jgi:hypothetical protein
VLLFSGVNLALKTVIVVIKGAIEGWNNLFNMLRLLPQGIGGVFIKHAESSVHRKLVNK